jgi:ubiquinone/menaquinone biosynthesis C-methylase UbiE
MSPENPLLSTRQNYNRLSRWYDMFSSSERRVAQTCLSLSNVQSGDNVLEIGFGTGHALIDLSMAVGGKGGVYGIDLSPGMVAVALRRIQHSGMANRISIQIGDASHLPYLDNLFESVFMSFTLELFSAIETPIVLSECRRVLQPAGWLGIISLSKKATFAVNIYEWFHFHFPKMIDCRPIIIRPLLKEAGFELAQTVEDRLWGLPVEAVFSRKS